MLNAIETIERLRLKDMRVLKNEKWLQYLTLTSERNINLERIDSFNDFNSSYILCYVEKTLQLLSNCRLNPDLLYYVEETLKWSEVSKGGLPFQRKKWAEKGYYLFAHNVGSAQIYEEASNKEETRKRRIIKDLIATHGLIGQYIRGEVPLIDNEPLCRLVKENLLGASGLREILLCLNYCIVSAVDENLWRAISRQAEQTIELILNERFDRQFTLKERLRRLRSVSIDNGENFDADYDKLMSDTRINGIMSELLEQTALWYVEAALFDFSFEEFIKIFLLVSLAVQNKVIRHISFELFMKNIYYQHDGRKRVNIYKKRIIEKYLSGLTIDSILSGDFGENPHVAHIVTVDDHLKAITFFDFTFSPAGGKLIEFCVEAE